MPLAAKGLASTSGLRPSCGTSSSTAAHLSTVHRLRLYSAGSRPCALRWGRPPSHVCTHRGRWELSAAAQGDDPDQG